MTCLREQCAGVETAPALQTKNLVHCKHAVLAAAGSVFQIALGFLLAWRLATISLASDAGGVPQWSIRASSKYECKCNCAGIASLNAKVRDPPTRQQCAGFASCSRIAFQRFHPFKNLVPSLQQASRNPCQRQGFVRCAPAHHCSLLCCCCYAMLDPEAERIG